MKNTKRALSLLLSLMLVLGAVAVGGMSASAELADNAELIIGNVCAIEGGDILLYKGTGWSITVNEDENGVTLSLDNLNLEPDFGCIYAQYLDLTITGSAKLTATGDVFEAIAVSEGNLTLNGDFVLSAQCDTGGALGVNGNLTVEGGSLSVINTGDNNAISTDTMTVNGGSVYAKTESGSDIYRAISAGITLNNGEAFALGDERAKEVLIKVPGQPPYITGDIIEYGTYPQSEVKDESTLAALNEKISDDGWVSYGYYSGTGLEESMEPSDYMKYQDVVLEGVKYRAVMFTAYRPYRTNLPCSADNSYQDDNGYYVSGEGGANVYWFKFEPVEWRVLDPDTGLVLCNSIIDSQAFSNTVFFNGYNPFTDSDLTLFAGDFANSSIRQWLNDDFINTAFSPAQQENIVLSEQPAYYPMGEVDVLILPYLTLTYTFEPTTEKVFLLTSKDSLNTEYGFSGQSGDTALIMSGSDYAESQGLDSAYPYYYSAWLTRTCSDTNANSVYAFDSRGEMVSVIIPDTSAGIVPAMHLTELVSDPTGAPAVIEIPEGIEDIYNNSEYTGVEAGEGYTLSGTVTATDAGNYTATATLEDGYIWSDGTYEDKEISWKIKPRLIWLTPEASLDNDTFVYDGTEKKPELAFLKDSYIDKELTEGVDYKIIHKEWRNNINASDPEEEDNEKLPTALFAIEGMGNYYHSIDQYLVFRIEKADPEVTAPVPVEGLRADGTPKELVTAGSTTGGTLEYSLDGENYSTDLPKASEEGAYTVYYRVTGNENYNDAEPKTVSAAIGEGSKDEPAAKAEISIKGENSLTLSYRQSKTYTAEAAGIPEGGSVVWYLNGEKAGEGRTFRVENPEKDYTLQSKVLDKDGNTVAESETVKVTVKHGFFDKLKAWLTDLLLGVFAPLFSKFEEVC
ncbi:MAG: hypothetical protein IJJ61_10800 [Clostridia bacterium]|nr:hypothetical protein [Clostridia bacterium]